MSGLGLSWDAATAFTYRDANERNFGAGEQWLRMNQATSLDGLSSALEEVHGIPWTYTVATDRDGGARLTDARGEHLRHASHASTSAGPSSSPG